MTRHHITITIDDKDSKMRAKFGAQRRKLTVDPRPTSNGDDANLEWMPKQLDSATKNKLVVEDIS
jgi:hypothetical protein